MRRVFRLGFCSIVLVFAVIGSNPTAGAAQQLGSGRTILASVVTEAGRPTLDIGVDDFVVSEDGDERDVLDAYVADYPVVLLLDDSAGGETADVIKRATARFITRIGQRPVAIGTLSNATALLTALDQARTEVLTQIAGMPTQTPDPQTALPLVAHAARILEDTGAPFSAIVVVTTRAVDAAIPVRGELLPVILESGAAVHVIEQRTTGDMPDTQDLLRVLADETHGQFTAIYTAASFAVALERLADRFASEMMIEYLAPTDSRRGDVRVGVRRPGARVIGLGVSK